MSSASRVRLFEVDPDLTRFLAEDELVEARQLTLPVLTFSRDEPRPLRDRLETNGAFAALVAEGMILEEMQVGDQVGVRLLGPGDIVSATPGGSSLLMSHWSARVMPGTHLALFGREMLLGARRWPGLTAGLHLRHFQQEDRLATQLVICQLPRVDQRLLALMWLLAETWGRVTPNGTALPLKLTHDILGALIGARRPTITLALRDLSERGALVRQDRGWLLLEEPPVSSGPPDGLRAPSLIGESDQNWTDHTISAVDAPSTESLEMLRDTVSQLRERHEANRIHYTEQLRIMRTARERSEANRRRIAGDRVRRRRSRSS